MASGNLFGEDDVVQDRMHFGTVRCISGSGILHCMKIFEFLRMFEAVKTAWDLILKSVQIKDENFNQRINQIDNLVELK